MAINPWGVSTHIDLFSCNDRAISNPKMIERFVIELCDLIGMRRFGDPQIVYFGQDERFQGYSLVQLIETSCITGHFAPAEDNGAFIDIFSCKPYNSKQAAAFCKEFFQAVSFGFEVVNRGL